MDNLNAHKNEKVRELIEATGASILFLPPYSPDYNPIEAAWAKVKHLVRSTLPKPSSNYARPFIERGEKSPQTTSSDGFATVDTAPDNVRDPDTKTKTRSRPGNAS